MCVFVCVCVICRIRPFKKCAPTKHTHIVTDMGAKKTRKFEIATVTLMCMCHRFVLMFYTYSHLLLLRCGEISTHCKVAETLYMQLNTQSLWSYILLLFAKIFPCMQMKDKGASNSWQGMWSADDSQAALWERRESASSSDANPLFAIFQALDFDLIM